MRLSLLLTLFFATTMVSSQLTAIIGATKGVAALTASVAKLATMLIPAKLLLPFATIGPLKLSLPILLLMKKAGLVKIKLVLVKAAILAPVGVATAKIGLIKASLGVGKSTMLAAGKTKIGLFKLPVTLAAAKMGGLLGAFSGAKGGLAAFKASPGISLREVFSRQAARIASRHSKLPQIPMKTVTIGVYHPEPSVPITETPKSSYEPEQPEASYGEAPKQSYGAEPVKIDEVKSSYQPEIVEPAKPAYAPAPEEIPVANAY